VEHQHAARTRGVAALGRRQRRACAGPACPHGLGGRPTGGVAVARSSGEEDVGVRVSHLISEEEPSASHMYARISSHTYDRQK
jgi:hypothetical protein